jgi:hypothetical protein
MDDGIISEGLETFEFEGFETHDFYFGGRRYGMWGFLTGMVVQCHVFFYFAGHIKNTHKESRILQL